MKHIVMLPPHKLADVKTQLMFMVTALPEEQRTVLMLFYHERLTLDEIAEVLDTPEGEVAALFYCAHANAGLCPRPEALEEVGELVGMN